MIIINSIKLTKVVTYIAYTLSILAQTKFNIYRRAMYHQCYYKLIAINLFSDDSIVASIMMFLSKLFFHEQYRKLNFKIWTLHHNFLSLVLFVRNKDP